MPAQPVTNSKCLSTRIIPSDLCKPVQHLRLFDRHSMRKARLPAWFPSLPLSLTTHFFFAVLRLEMLLSASHFKAVLRFLRGRTSNRSCPAQNPIPTVHEPQSPKDLRQPDMPLDSRFMTSNKVPVERPTRYRRASSVSFVSIPTVTNLS
ncbi:hypothetical protein MSAN_00321500 [Mycena sanguinolenta]|uniref:Uncharacterized protein n=1 Tax=Mycena sanguinolenta TaxID=230812 RepID=A0A8H6ZEW4_9AGAR|nr:hypothetical protein MSAN_00321500 [Mycena sanguinolenta]